MDREELVYEAGKNNCHFRKLNTIRTFGEGQQIHVGMDEMYKNFKTRLMLL